MSRSRPDLSIALPPGFAFPTNNASVPQTPENQFEEQNTAAEPPPPPRQKYTVKRRRAEIPFEPVVLPDMDSVIPTIEMSESLSESSSPMFQPTTGASGLLSPMPVFTRLVTPRTPCGRTNSLSQLDTPSHEWDLINDSRSSFHRSSSVCSSFSDSSVSSGGSSGFSAPLGCMSPESVATDVFTEDDISKADKLILSPSERSSSPSAKRVKRHRNVNWTPEMDQHLENTYIRYLADPRVTPFKTLPGVSPPLGVCNRVAVRARHTWSQYRAVTPSALDTILEAESSQREGSPDTIRPETIGNVDRKQPQWPRSDAAARKRLRKLVKSKPALAAHYQRLLRTRSPSPFTSTSSANRSSEPPPSAFSSTFSGEDMKMSLITSTAPSMQPEGPLAQLVSDDVDANPTPLRPQSQRGSRPTDWFARIGRSQAHQKSVSLQSGLSLETDIIQSGSTSLASPFDYSSNRSHLLHSMSTTKSLGRNEFNNLNGKRPSLDSPFELKGAPTLPRSLKRRFKSDEEKPRRPVLADVFGPPAEESTTARNRGLSLGAVRATDNLTKLFVPPPAHASPPDHEMTEAPSGSPSGPDMSQLVPIGSRSVPRRLAEPVPRLGSPFTETPGVGRMFNTFPRNYVPTANNPTPFHQRLREIAAESKQGNSK